MFYDLNVPYNPSDPEIANTLAFLAEGEPGSSNMRPFPLTTLFV